MSLITCPDCKKEISSSAEKCPNCGYPIHKAKEIIEKEASKSDYKRGCLITIGIIVIIAVIVGLCSKNDDEKEKSPVKKDLNVTIQFTGTQFIMTNNDNFTYYNCDIELNDKYYLKGVTLEAGQSYTVGMMQFADKHGNRFGLMQKPQTVFVSCPALGGTRYYYGEWK